MKSTRLRRAHLLVLACLRFAEDCSAAQVLLKLDRYEQAARRVWHRALNSLLALRTHHENSHHRRARIHARESEAVLCEILAEPNPLRPRVVANTQESKTNPMPKHLERELAAHRSRDPLFDTVADRSQMINELRKYFD